MMKRTTLCMLLICLVSVGFGQSMKKATKFYDDKNFEKAKAEVDALLAKNPSDGEAIYLKSKIYAKIADSAALRSLVNGDARAEAFDAFKKAVADSNNMKVKLAIMRDNYQPIIEMYSGYYQAGIDAFNEAAQAGGKEGFKKSMDNFIKANEVGHYIAENGWATIGEVDTLLVLNIGRAAVNAEDEAAAKKYFSMLADAKITGVAGTDDDSFVLPYHWLETYYRKEGDEANMIKYAQMGSEAFPKEPVFNLILIEYFRDKKDMPKALSYYPHILQGNPDSTSYYQSYASDIFNYVYNSDDDVTVQNKEQWLDTLNKQVHRAIELNPDDVVSNWLASQYYYSQGIEYRDSAMKTTDAAAKADLNAKAKENFNKAVPYGEKAIAKLTESPKASDKSRYRSIVNLMQNIYQSMGDRENLKKYQDMYDNADNVFGK